MLKIYAISIRGTTSACAENTCRLRGLGSGKRNYLRVRGEYFFRYGTHLGFQELPPRARRIRHDR